MNIRRLPFWLRAGLFLLAYVGSAKFIPVSGGAAFPVLWLPTGLAVAAVISGGIAFAPLVGVAALIVTRSFDLPWLTSLGIAAADTLEAACAAFLLGRWTGFDPGLRRFRDVVVFLLCAAVLAPMVSATLGSPLAAADFNRLYHFDAGFWWIWWRMNAIGVVVVTPVILAWHANPPRRVGTRTLLEAGISAVAIVVLGSFLLLRNPPGALAYATAFALLPALLYPAVRFGPRGGATVSLLLVLTTLFATARGSGPFVAAPSVAQVGTMQAFFLLTSVTVLALGAAIAERESALGDLRLGEATLRGILDAIPDVIYRLRKDGTYLSVRTPPGLQLPVPAEQLIGRTLAEAFPDDDVGASMALISKALQTGEPQQTEMKTRLNGRIHYREARYVPIAGDEVLCLTHDISERRWASHLLAWEATVLQLVVTGRPLQEILDALSQGIEHLVDGGICTILLLRDGRLYHGAAPSVPPEYSRAIDGTLIGPVAGSCGTAAFFNRLVVVEDIRSDPLWAEFAQFALPHGLLACWSSPIRSSTGQVLGTFAIYHREPHHPSAEELATAERGAVVAGIVLEREQREDALRTSRELLESLNHNISEGLFRSTPDGKLLYANQAFATMFGYPTVAEIVEVSTTGLHYSPEDRRRLMDVLAEQGSLRNEEVYMTRKDGTTFWGLTSTTAVTDTSGKLLCLDGALTDVTARRQLEEQLRQSQKMDAVGKLAGGVAHDFNNLLTAITGYTELLLAGLPADSPASQDAHEIARAATRAAGLTRQLLAFSRKQLLSPEVLDPVAVVDGLTAMLGRLIGEHIRLLTPRSSRPVRLRADRGQLEQVLLNLVLNARDAMPEGGTLTIAVDPVELGSDFLQSHAGAAVGRHVRIAVCDTGIGMDEETRSRAFDPFFTTKEQGKGTGLGLSTVYGIVKQSGGSVYLESRPGAGTTVMAYLPEVEGEPSTPEREASHREPISAQGNVLVVEDEQVVRDLVCRVLGQAGYTVLSAENGEQALRLAAEFTGYLDLVITDIVMPRLNGRELADRLCRICPGVQVLYVSGYTNDQLSRHGVLDPGLAYLQKPFTPAVLLARVQSLLGRNAGSERSSH